MISSVTRYMEVISLMRKISLYTAQKHLTLNNLRRLSIAFAFYVSLHQFPVRISYDSLLQLPFFVLPPRRFSFACIPIASF
jgi:hypothetical protein